MAAFALLDVDLAADELDLACFTNQISLNVEVNELDATTFCSSGWSTPIGGIKRVSWTASGPTDMATATASQTSAVDEILAVDLGTTYVLSAVPAGDGTAGNAAYFGQGLLAQRTILDGAVGDLATHSVTFAGQRLIRGRVEHAATLTATGSSTGSQLGAVSATQRLWAAVHFFTAGGTTPSCTVKIQSDDNGSFTSATDRITFTAATDKGAQFSSVVGAITDDWWRATWTISGTNPSFQTRILIGIA